MGIQRGIIKFGARLFFKKYILTGVPAIIQNSKGQILLGKRNKNMIYYPQIWGLPGGLIEYKETIPEAIKRELKEELDVDIEITKYGKPLMQLPTKKQKMQYLDTPVYCKLLKGQQPKPKDETSEIKWFSPKEIRNMNLAYNHKEILKNEKII